MPWYESQLEKKILNRRLINEETGCWLWTGGKDGAGYGKVWCPYHGGQQSVHRVAAMLWMGYSLSDELFVLHQCNNPSCFNPEHMYVGTPQENMDDRSKVGNQYRREQRKLDDEAVRTIRALHSEGVKGKDIAELFKVSKKTVSYIVNHKTYADVGED